MSDPERRDMPSHTILESHDPDTEESWDEEDLEFEADGEDGEDLDLDDFDAVDDDDDDDDM